MFVSHGLSAVVKQVSSAETQVQESGLKFIVRSLAVWRRSTDESNIFKTENITFVCKK